jgi:hypothetical protein
MATRSLGQLTLDVVAKIGGFERGMDAAERKADSTARNITRKQRELARQIDAAWAGAIKAIGAGVAIGTTVFAGMTRSALQSADAIKDLSEATGGSIENISALDDLARRTGTNLDNVGGILVKFNQTLKDADPTKGPGAVIKALNLDIEALKRLDPAEALRQTAVALSTFADDGDKARAIQELFGKSVKEAAPFLKDLSEQQKLSATLTREQAEEFDELNKMLLAAKTDITNLSRTMVGDLVPSVLEVIRQLQSGREAFGSFWSAAANIGTSRTFGTNLDALKFYRDELVRVEKAQAALRNETSSFFRGFGEERLSKQAQELRKFVDYYQRLLGLTGGKAGGGRGFVNPNIELPRIGSIPGGPPPAAAGGRTPRVAAERESDYQRAMQQLQEQLDRTKTLTVAEGVLLDVQAGRLKLLSGETVEPLLVLARQIDAVKALSAAEDARMQAVAAGSAMTLRAEEAALAEVDAIFQANEALRDEIALLMGDAETHEALERARLSSAIATKQEQLAMLLNADATKAETDAIAQQIAALKERLKLLGDRRAAAAFKEQTRTAEDFAQVLSRGVGDAIINFRDLRSVVGGVEQQLLQMITNLAVVKPLEKSITDLISGAMGSSGGGDLFGNLFKSLFSGFFADGGFIGPGQWGIAGEEGPEPVFGGRTGVTVQPSTDRSVSVTNNFVIHGQMTRATQGQIAAEVSRSVRREAARGTA